MAIYQNDDIVETTIESLKDLLKGYADLCVGSTSPDPVEYLRDVLDRHYGGVDNAGTFVLYPDKVDIQ